MPLNGSVLSTAIT